VIAYAILRFDRWGGWDKLLPYRAASLECTRPKRCRALTWIPLTLLAAGLAGGQDVRRLQLPPATARVSGDFARARIREIADGRVLIANGVISVLDLTTGKLTPITRRGPGPKEHSYYAFHIVAMRGDSSVFMDLDKRLIFSGAEPVQSITPSYIWRRGNADLRGMPDTMGYASGTVGDPGSVSGTSYLVRVNITTGEWKRLDTLRCQARVYTAKLIIDPVPNGEDTKVQFPDGWIAIARRDPYRVDWWDAQNKVVRGKPLPFTAVPVNDDEKEYLLRLAARARGKESIKPEEYARAWSDTYPPFEAQMYGNPLPMPDGRLLIRRMSTSKRPENWYDIVNRQGGLDAQLVIPANERIISFGPKSVFIVEEDGDGETWLRRHAWPPPTPKKSP
jgi:hypothetical protein